MEQTAKDQHEVHSVKRRGRPPKVAPEPASVLDSVQSPFDVVRVADPSAQSYAERIFAGQSVDLPRGVRIERCRAGVEAQGMSFDGVTLP